jgi:hypothetical protein
MFPDRIISHEYADIDEPILSANVTFPLIVMLLDHKNKQLVYEFQEYPSHSINSAFPIISRLLNVELNPELLKVQFVTIKFWKQFFGSIVALEMIND